MGMYINATQNGPLGSKKVKSLVEAGACLLGRNTPQYQENLICVVNNGAWEAAGYCYSENEFKDFAHEDGRSKVWLTWDKVKEYAY